MEWWWWTPMKRRMIKEVYWYMSLRRRAVRGILEFLIQCTCNDYISTSRPHTTWHSWAWKHSFSSFRHFILFHIVHPNFGCAIHVLFLQSFVCIPTVFQYYTSKKEVLCLILFLMSRSDTFSPFIYQKRETISGYIVSESYSHTCTILHNHIPSAFHSLPLHCFVVCSFPYPRAYI